MDTVNELETISILADSVAADPATPAGGIGGGLGGFMRAVTSGADYILIHPFQDFSNVISIFAGLVTGNHAAFVKGFQRLGGWTVGNPVAALRAWTRRQLASFARQVLALQKQLTELIYSQVRTLRRQMIARDRLERHRRIAGDRAAEQQARREIRALHQVIEREAAGAYSDGKRGRMSLISRILDHVASRNAIVRGLTRDIVSGLLDLLAVDNPVARIGLGFLLRRLVGRLGVDRAAGAFAGDLLGPLLGDPRPHDLAGVIRDISGRLGALEGQWGQFYQDGGADILQAGREWSAITGPVADIALIAWLGEAAIDPQAWARQVTDVTGPVLNAAKDVMSGLIR
jgi:hypothetical protein